MGERSEGSKNFVMMVTDDALQDEHGVAACDKAIVYKKYLHKHIKKG
jgi:hypothetical protein